MPLYDFVCSDGHEAEARAEYGVSALPCTVCGKRAERRTVNAVSFVMAGQTVVPLDQRRVNLSKFMDAATDLDYHHKNAEERQGREINSPNYFREGVRRANEVLAGKRPPPKEF